MIRATIAATALLGFAGLITAAPAFADTPFDITCGDGSHGPCYTTDGPVYTDTIHNYLVFGPKTANSYAHLPSDTVNGYQNAIPETIKQYTGVDIGAPASAPSGSPSP